MKIVKEFVLRTIAGESILVPVGMTSQEYHGMINLSPTAAFIWENLEKTDSLEELVEKLTGEFEVDRETAERDAALFVGKLLEYGFIALTREDLRW